MKTIKNIITISIICFTHFFIFGHEKTDATNRALERPSDEIEYCTIRSLFYTVQIGVYSKPISSNAFPHEARPIYCLKRSDGLYAYFSGIYDCRFEAMAKRFEIVCKGVYDAYLAVYYNRKKISIPMADNLIEANGKSILYNSNQNILATE